MDLGGRLVLTTEFLTRLLAPWAVDTIEPREVVLIIFGDKLGALLLQARYLRCCVSPLDVEDELALLGPSILEDQRLDDLEAVEDPVEVLWLDLLLLSGLLDL